MAASTQSGFFSTDEEGVYVECRVEWVRETPRTGRFVFKLLTESAPRASANFLTLVDGRQAWRNPENLRLTNEPFFQATIGSQIYPAKEAAGKACGLVVFGGRKTGYLLDDEINWGLSHDRPGVVSMRSSGANANGGRFQITTTNPWNYPTALDGRHSIFAQVVAGQTVVDALARAEIDAQNVPVHPMVLEVVECLAVGEQAEEFVLGAEALYARSDFQGVQGLAIERLSGDSLCLEWDRLPDCDYFVYVSTDLQRYEYYAEQTHMLSAEALVPVQIDLGADELPCRFFSVFATVRPTLPSLEGESVVLDWGLNVLAQPIELALGNHGLGVMTWGHDVLQKQEHVRASLLDHHQPAYAAQVDESSRSQSWGLWSKPVEVGTGSMDLVGADRGLAVFEGEAGARAYISSVGSVEAGRTYVFSVDVEASEGSGSILIARAHGLTVSSGANQIHVEGGTTGRYAMRFTALEDDPVVHFRVGLGAYGAIATTQMIALSHPMLQDVTDTEGLFDDWVAYPEPSWRLPGNSIVGGDVGRVMAGLGAALEPVEDSYALGFGIGDSFANNSGDWIAQLGSLAEKNWAGRFLGKGIAGGTLVRTLEPAFDNCYSLLGVDYDYVVFQGGVNDVNHSDISLEELKFAVSSLVAQARAKGVRQIFICNIAPWSNYRNWTPGKQAETQAYNGWLSLYCPTAGVHLIDLYAALGDSTDPTKLSDGSNGQVNYDSGDGLHPNLAGHRVIAELIVAKLQDRRSRILQYDWIDHGSEDVQLRVQTDSFFADVQYYLNFSQEKAGTANVCVREYDFDAVSGLGRDPDDWPQVIRDASFEASRGR